MSTLGKLVVCTLLAYASAMPKIQHRAEGNPSGFDFSQYFSNEKLQEYLKENPSALNYFNLPNQQAPASNNAIQSDVMEDNNQQYAVPDFQKHMKACMQNYQQSFSTSSSQSSSGTTTTTSGTKADNNQIPWANGFDQFNSQQFNNYVPQQFSGYGPQQFSGYGPQQYENYQKCMKEWQSAASQGGYSPPDFTNFSPPSNFGSFAPQGFNFPNTGSSSSSNTAAASS